MVHLTALPLTNFRNRQVIRTIHDGAKATRNADSTRAQQTYGLYTRLVSPNLLSHPS
jgi:hypothetical protein